MKPDDVICYCFHVTWRKLENWTRRHRPRVASQLSACGGAGTGCGWCIPFLKLIHRRATHNCAVAQGTSNSVGNPLPDDLIRLSPEEYSALRAEYIRAGKGRPPSDQQTNHS
ncbi:MAG: (2Fe-2S)-binding protein [Gemmataceae bacterium]|nr:(2Fe-2S)-binding protein [Gemmataceae bacterium]MCS7271407.1 (2Fe-2S)-binding protein [Gemmataceae bacterium]MDW8244093.1 (2Fe-2S)-binding protein [Thermogemmata sp.]